MVVTHPDKVFFAERGDTKLDLVRYYQSGARARCWRPWAGGRCCCSGSPTGRAGRRSSRSGCPRAGPTGCETTIVSTPNGTTSQALVVADLAHVLWAVNLGCLGFHVWPSKAADPEHADELRIDLDPTPGVTFPMLQEAADEVRALLDELGVVGLPKTTGNRGIHVYVRLQPRWTSYEVRSAAVAVARELERRRPDLITAAWWKEERGTRVFVDFNQNAPHKTIFGAWSVRARPGAQVSTPFAWDELDAIHPDDLTIANVPARVAAGGDPWAAMTDEPAVAGAAARPARARPGRRPARRPVAARLPQDARRAAPGRPQPSQEGDRMTRRTTGGGPTVRRVVAGAAIVVGLVAGGCGDGDSSTATSTTTAAPATTSATVTSTPAPTVATSSTVPAGTRPTVVDEVLMGGSEVERYTYQLTIPKLQGLGDLTVQTAVNDQIRAQATGAVDEFVVGVKDFGPPPPGQQDQRNGLTGTYEVSRLDDGLASFRVRQSRFFVGAAHPNAAVVTFNYDLHTGKRLALADLFTVGSPYLAMLTDLSRQLLPAQPGFDGLQSFVMPGTEPKEENFDGWTLSDQDLVITFDEGQVAPNAMGMPHVSIPFASLRLLLDPAGPLAIYN